MENKINTYSPIQQFTSLVVSPDSSSVFFTATESPSTPQTCKFQYSTNTLSCFNSNMYGYTHSFLVINSYTSFITIDSDTQHYSEIRKIELNTTAIGNIWVSRMNCPIVCGSIHDQLLLNSDSSILYAFMNIDYKCSNLNL